MQVIKRCGLFVLSFVVSLTASLGVLSNSVNAASIYDDLVTVTSDFTVRNYDGSKSGDMTNYVGKIQELCSETTYNLVLNNIANDYNRAVVVFDTSLIPDSGQGRYIQFFFETTDSHIEYPSLWNTNELLVQRNQNTMVELQLGFNYDNDNITCALTSNSSSNNIALARTFSGYPAWQPIFSTYPVTYPEGYDGQIIPETYDPPGELTVVRPEYDWQVELRSITLNNISTPPPGVEPYRVKFDIVVGTFDPDDFVELYEVVLDPQGSQRIDLTRLAPVGITAYYINLDGTRKEDTDEFDYRETIVTFNVDGSTFSGTTVGAICNDEDVCEVVETPRYEDCSVYNTDIELWSGGPNLEVWSVETLSCEINNFWLRLMDFLNFLFVPDMEAITNAMNTFMGVLEEKLGFVYTSFEYLIQWITSILVVSPDCIIDTGDGEFFGASVQFDICTFEDAAPNVWAYGIGFARLLFAAGLVFLSYNRLFTILKGLGK